MNERHRQRRPRRSLRDLLRYLLRIRGSPEAVARGVAIGMLVAFSPTVGIQIPLVLVLATLLNANRLSALLPIWLTNVLTVPAVYGFTYWVGSHCLGGPRYSLRYIMGKLRSMVALNVYDMAEYARDFSQLSREVLMPMAIGGLLVGGLAAALCYPLTLYAIRRFRARRLLKIQHRASYLASLRALAAQHLPLSGLGRSLPSSEDPAGTSGGHPPVNGEADTEPASSLSKS